MQVRITVDDRDPHGAGCRCGLCNRNGTSYGASVYPADAVDPEAVERCYAASDVAAETNARLWCVLNGHEIVDDAEVSHG